jgi:hypothetical protein
MSSVTKTQFTHTQERNMLNQISSYFCNLLHKFAEPETYGSQLEQYIVSHNPTNTAQVEHLERQFELKYLKRNSGWV